MPARAWPSGLEIETSFSWVSAAPPVFHVLVRNNGTRARTLGFAVPGSFRCKGKRLRGDAERFGAFLALTSWHDPRTNGVVRPGEWLHRSYPLGLEAELQPPCEVTFNVSDLETAERVGYGTVPVPSEQPDRVFADFSTAAVSADVLVEADRGSSGLLIARVLVRNESSHDLTLYQAERSLACEGEGRAQWPVLEGVLQGEDAGPANVAPGSWTVFVNVVGVEQAAPASCSASFRIEALHKDLSRRKVAAVSTVLEPQGYLSRPWRRR